MRLFVGNIPSGVDEFELIKFFSERNLAVSKATIIKDQHTGRSRGFGFIEIEYEEEHKKTIIDSLHNTQMKNNLLTIGEAKPKLPKEEYAKKYAEYNQSQES